MSEESYRSLLTQVIGQEARTTRSPSGTALFNLHSTFGANPDEEAKNIALQEATGTPTDLMKNPEIKRNAEIQNYLGNVDLSKAPATSGWLENEQNAALSAGEVPAIIDFETMVGTAARENLERVGDVAGALTSGVLLGARGVVGIANYLVVDKETGKLGYVGRWLQDDVGLNLAQAQEVLRKARSKAQQRADAAYAATEGPLESIGALLNNPSVIFMTVLESLPLAFVGGKVGTTAARVAPKALAKLASALSVSPGVVAAAMGEGAITTGVMAESFRAESPDQLLGLKPAVAAVGAGVGAAAIAGVSGKVSERLGATDVDKLFLSEELGGGLPLRTAPQSVQSAIKSMATAALIEATEETFQELQEKMWENWASGRELTTGLSQPAVLGFFSGGFQAGATDVAASIQGSFNRDQTLANILQEPGVSEELTRLRENAPEQFEDLSRRIFQNAGVETVYMQADKIADEAATQAISSDDLLGWLESYGVSEIDFRQALDEGGVVGMEHAKVSTNLETDPLVKELLSDFTMRATDTPLSGLAETIDENNEAVVHMRTLFQQVQENRIGQDDIAKWREDLLATPKAERLVTGESLMPLIAFANVMSEQTGVEAITHLNEMLGPGGLKVESYKQFQARQPAQITYNQDTGVINRDENFKRWFDRSKVVDDAGKALKVFHRGYFEEDFDPVWRVEEEGAHFGTRAAADMRETGKPADSFIAGADLGQDDAGRWHWDSEGVSSSDLFEEGFATEEEAKANLDQTAVDMLEGVDTEFELPLTEVYLAIKNPKRVGDQKDNWRPAIKKAKAEGHDGIVYRNEFEDKGSESYIAFYPEQIKSVNNTGAFSSTDPSVLHQFAGPQALTADRSQLMAAQRMKSEGGLSSEDIRKETGWFLGKDKKWRFEIDDSDLTTYDIPARVMEALASTSPYRNLRSHRLDTAVQLQELIDHPALFEAYPQLKTLLVIFNTKAKNQYSAQVPLDATSSAAAIELSVVHVRYRTNKVGPAQLKILIHEIQHAIQDIEGTARGGGTSSSTRAGVLEQLTSRLFFSEGARLGEGPLQKKLQELQDRLSNVDEGTDTKTLLGEVLQAYTNRREIEGLSKQKDVVLDATNYEVYLRLLGEVEARAAAERLDLSEAQRTELPPYEATLYEDGIPEDEVIVWQRDNAAASTSSIQTLFQDDGVKVSAAAQSIVEKLRGFRENELVPFSKLRDQAGEAFDQAIMELAEKEQIFLHRHVGTLNERNQDLEKYLQVKVGEDQYVGAVLRLDRPALASDLPAKAKGKDPLGALTTSAEGENIVHLFKKANKSSFLHETGHIFLNQLKLASSKYGVMQEQWDTTKAWLGVENETVTEKQHEKFARSFEAYLAEGEAPSALLEKVFRSFQKWLTRVYRALGVPDADLNPQVRDLFDHLLATENEIHAKRAEAVFVAAIEDKVLRSTGFTEEQIQELHKLVQNGADEAIEKRNAYKFKGRNERLKEWRAEAREASAREPIYGFTAEVKAAGGIDRASAVRAFGKENVPPSNPAFKKGGLDVNVAIAEHGEAYGYENSAQYREALSHWQPRLRWEMKYVAGQEAAYVNRQDTEEVIRTQSVRRLLELESKWLAQEADVFKEFAPANKPLHRQVIRQWAEAQVGQTKMADLHKFSYFKRLAAQSRKYRQKVISAARKAAGVKTGTKQRKFWIEALAHNERARLNEELIIVSHREAALREKMVRRWKRNTKHANDLRKGKVKITQPFRDQVNRLLSVHAIADKEYNPSILGLNEFAQSLIQGDLEGTSGGAYFSDWIGQQPIDTTQITWSQAQELDAAITFLMKHGKDAIKESRMVDGVTLDVWSDAILEQTKDAPSKPQVASDATRLSRFVRGIQKKYREWLAWSGTLRFIAERVDNFDSDGFFQKLIQKLVNDEAEGNDLFKEISTSMEPAIDLLARGKAKVFGDLPITSGMAQENYTWIKERVVTTALNMGNLVNLRRLEEGNGLDEATRTQIASKLTEAEWMAIQKIWDTIDSLWPRIADTFERMEYMPLKKEDAQPLTVITSDGKTITLRGGYFPIKYDRQIVEKAAQFSEAENLMEAREGMLQTPTTKSGFTNARVESVGWPLELSLGHLYTHFKDVIKYVTVAEDIRSIDRITRNKALSANLKRVLGKEMAQMIRPALKAVVRPEVFERGAMEAFRIKYSTFVMGYNAWTAFQNVTGIFPAIYHVGARSYLNGLNYVWRVGFRNAWKTMLEASPYMRLREENVERDARKIVKQFGVKGVTIGGVKYTLEDVLNTAFIGIRAIDTMVSIPGWWGRYHAEMEKHGDMQKAADAANIAINKALGSGLAFDTTTFMRDGHWSILVPFMSFAATQREVLETGWEAMRAGKISGTELLYRELMVWLLPAMASTFLRGIAMYGLLGAMGADDDRDQQVEAWDYVEELVSYRLMGTPLVRDVWNTFAFGLEGPAPKTAVRLPLFEGLRLALEVSNKLGTAVTSKDENAVKRVAWAVAEVIALYIRFPATKVYQKIMRGLEDIKERDGGITNLLIPMERKRRKRR